MYTYGYTVKTHGQEHIVFFVILKMVLMLFVFSRETSSIYTYAYTVKIHGQEDGLSCVISKMVWMIICLVLGGRFLAAQPCTQKLGCPYESLENSTPSGGKSQKGPPRCTA